MMGDQNKHQLWPVWFTEPETGINLSAQGQLKRLLESLWATWPRWEVQYVACNLSWCRSTGVLCIWGVISVNTQLKKWLEEQLSPLLSSEAPGKGLGSAMKRALEIQGDRVLQVSGWADIFLLWWNTDATLLVRTFHLKVAICNKSWKNLRNAFMFLIAKDRALSLYNRELSCKTTEENTCYPL